MSHSIRLLFALLAAVELLATATGTPIMDDSENEYKGRMIGGDAVHQDDHPSFMASLRSLTDVHFCGGVIVSDRYILTAAHCTHGRIITDINVVVGTTLRRAGGVAYRSSTYINHPGFDHNSLLNDIALVMTAVVIVFADNIQVALINPSLSVDKLSVEISGFGVTNSGINYFEPNLHIITTETISNDECVLKQSPENVWRITESKMCTLAPGRGICYGDEGGAIYSGSEIIGIASWHSHCNIGIPNVYERVSVHRLWIQSYIV